jgi:hypothetical protein
MWIPIPLLLVAPLLQEQASPPAPAAINPSQQAWEAFQKRLAEAQGLNLSASMSLSDPSIPPEEMVPVKMSLHLVLARPAAGQASWTSTFGEGEEADVVRLEWIGTGAKVYGVDHDEKWALAEGADWKSSELGYFLPFLGPTWSQVSMNAQEWRPLPAPVDYPEWKGLAIRGLPVEEDPELAESELVELQVWLGPDGLLRRAVSSLGGTAVIVFNVSAMSLTQEPDLEKLSLSLPEGYEVLEEEILVDEPIGEEDSLADSLLPVGAQAPEVTMLGMDDREVSLSSLRGKTVLLNFWFFH